MKREILFKAKTYNGEWVFGFPITIGCNVFIFQIGTEIEFEKIKTS